MYLSVILFFALNIHNSKQFSLSLPVVDPTYTAFVAVPVCYNRSCGTMNTDFLAKYLSNNWVLCI
jgi:hypothetical protein